MSPFPEVSTERAALREHTLERVVTAADIDELGHVNNVRYLSWCEQAAREHSARVGMDIPVLRALGCLAVVRQHNITYHKPALEGERLRVQTRLVSSEGIRARREFTICRLDGDAQGTLLADCMTDWVWIAAATGRPKRPDPRIARAFGFE